VSGFSLWRQEQRRRGAAARETRKRIADVARSDPNLTREDLAERFETADHRIVYALAKYGLKRPLHG
jgi:hypothetical protein